MRDVLIAYGQTETSPVNHMTAIGRLDREARGNRRPPGGAL